MKFIAADVILLIVGILLLGGASTGLVATGGFQAAAQQGSSSGLFNITFSTFPTTGDSKPVANYNTGNVEFQVSQTNITKLSFNVQCTDPAPNNSPAYTLTVNIEGPNGLKKSQNFQCADNSVTVEVPVANAPKGGAVSGTTEDEARSHIQNDANATKGTGKWTVRTTGSRGMIPGPLATTLGNPSGAIELKLEQWRPVLTPGSK